MKIALAQMRSEKGDWQGNLERVESYMAQAKDADCDIVVFPEMSLSGYCDPALFPHSVQPLESDWIVRFIALTEKYNIVASAGFIEVNPEGKPFITQVLAQNGRVAGTYCKRHVVDEEADWFSSGNHTPIFRLRLPGGELPCAIAICADSDNPQIWADAAQGGARLVLHSSAPGLYGRRTTHAEWQDGFDWYKSYLAERLPDYARKHGLFIAVATQTGATIDEDFPGGSFVFAPSGDVLAESPDWSEMVVYSTLEIPE